MRARHFQPVTLPANPPGIENRTAIRRRVWERMFPLTAWLVSGVVLQCWGAFIWSLGLIRYQDRPYFDVTPITHGWVGMTLGIWQRWDAIHYYRLALNGYSDALLSAFFPLYPLLGRLVSAITHLPVLFSLLVVSNLAFAGVLIVFYRLSESWFGRQSAQAALIFLMLFPYAYFFRAPYTESLALLLVLAALLAAREGRWAAAALLGFLAGLSRGTVFPLALALFWLAWEERSLLPFSRNILHYLTGLTPVLGNVVFFLWRSVHGFPPLSQVVEEYWMRRIAPPWDTLTKIAFLQKLVGLPADFWLNLFILLLVIAINLWGWKSLPNALRLYQAGLLAFLLLNQVPHDPLASLGRYSLLMFPNYTLLAAWARTPGRRWLMICLLLILQLVLVSQFFLWGWTG